MRTSYDTDAVAAYNIKFEALQRALDKILDNDGSDEYPASSRYYR